MQIETLEAKTLPELRAVAREHKMPGFASFKKQDLIVGLLRVETQRRRNGDVQNNRDKLNGEERLQRGVLEVVSDGIGFMRAEGYLPGKNDIYVSQSQIKRFGLRTGDMLIGVTRPPNKKERSHGLSRVLSVNGVRPEAARNRPNFDRLTPIFPDERFDLETLPRIASTRLINLIAPIGKGQRGLIVSPPKAGKTTVLKDIANAISKNYPDVHLMVALIGERPEEVTDMDRSVDAEVIASTFDDPVSRHVRVAEMALERAKRLVEAGRDVVIMLDSITRLARAYNLIEPSSGRTLSGGLDPSAIHPPKRLFGAARNVEHGGSLTIVATCLVNTGSKMDDVIYEEFKGTGNMELHLSRKLQERRIFPAFDVEQSSTRREEMLLGDDIANRVITMRRMWSHLTEEPAGIVGATEDLLRKFKEFETNQEFLDNLRQPNGRVVSLPRQFYPNR